MDVYNLILDRGYLGALDYANQIEGKNFRLASEIDKIVSELYVIASGLSSVRYAQRAIPQFPRFDTNYAPAPAPSRQQSSPYSPSGADPIANGTGEISAPGDMENLVGAGTGLLSAASLIGKVRVLRDKGVIAADLSNRIINFLKTQNISQPVFKAIEGLLKSGNFSGIINVMKGSQGTAGKSAGKVMEMLVAAAGKFKFLGPVVELIGKTTKILGPLSIAFDTYDIYTDYEREGLSGRVMCKIVSAILGIATLINALTPGANLVLAALWTVSSIGCGLIPQSNKSDEDYKNLNQSEIDKAESTVTLESLPKRDQDLVSGLLNSDSKEKLLNSLRDLRNNRKFEKPIQALALIQRELASWQPKIVPMG